jgi:hypothetical protein
VGSEARQLLWLFVLKGRAHLGDVVAGGTVILKWILKEWGVRMWAPVITVIKLRAA